MSSSCALLGVQFLAEQPSGGSWSSWGCEWLCAATSMPAWAASAIWLQLSILPGRCPAAQRPGVLDPAGGDEHRGGEAVPVQQGQGPAVEILEPVIECQDHGPVRQLAAAGRQDR